MVIVVFSNNLLLDAQWKLLLEIKQTHHINTEIRQQGQVIHIMPLRSPGSVLPAGSTSGHGHNLPEPSTANTSTGASRAHPPVTEKGAASPPPGRLTTLHLLEQIYTSLVSVSSESGTEMFVVADVQLVIGWNSWRHGATERWTANCSKSNTEEWELLFWKLKRTRFIVCYSNTVTWGGNYTSFYFCFTFHPVWSILGSTNKYSFEQHSDRQHSFLMTGQLFVASSWVTEMSP